MRTIPGVAGMMLFGACVCWAQAGAGWPTYGGDPGGQRFSGAVQIDRSNVRRLTPAWTYHTHALDVPIGGHRSAAFEATPILFRGTLYLTTPFDKVIALDPATGEERWTYVTVLPQLFEGNLITSRGVAAWEGAADGACAARVFFGTLDARLIALDAATGKPCEDFGDHGQVDLTKGVEHKVGQPFAVTSAPTVVGDVVVVGSSIPDNQAVDVEMGTVRAFDVRTGRQLWGWDPIPWALGQTVRTGAGNAWSTIAADPALGLLYVPTGSASPDYYGAMRPGDDRDADSLVALDAKTGRKVWAFQTVHHNVWDYDVAAEPVLFTWRKTTPAVAVTTKTGQVFVLDRRTGVPLFPVEERAVPQSDVPDEHTSATQPISSLPALGPMTLDEGAGGWQRDKGNADFCAQQIGALRYDGLYTPPSLRGSVEFPGPLGGVNWGSPAFDPGSGVLYANNNRYAYEVWLVPRPKRDRFANAIILLTWAEYPIFHLGPRREAALALVLLAFGCVLRRRLTPGWIAGVPAVLLLVLAGSSWSLFHYKVKTRAMIEDLSLQAPFGDDLSPDRKTPYLMHRKPIVDHEGRPCTKTPWSALTAINLDTGQKLWEMPAGTMISGEKTGTVGLGGPMVTGSGLVFTAATREPLLRAYDGVTGAEIWQGKLPVPAQSTPMTYMVDGRQYVVIAAGGHGTFGTPQGDSLVAFALP